jgi:hypothetical protein
MFATILLTVVATVRLVSFNAQGVFSTAAS